MKNFKAIKKFNIKEGEANFLIGLAGNGLSTSIQQEMYSSKFENLHYLNYINFSDTSESFVLLGIMNCIVSSCTGLQLTEELIDGFHTPFNVFKSGIDSIKKGNKAKRKEILIIFDEFQRIKNYSNAFFFTLDKILSITKIIPELVVTSVLISDQYINPLREERQEGLGKLFYHHPNFDVIKAKKIEEVKKYSFVEKANLSDLALKKIYLLGGFNPSLLTSLVGVKNIENESPEILLKNYEIEWKIQEIWDSLDKPNQELLKVLVSGKPLTFENTLQKRFLIETGVMDNALSKINLELLKIYIQKQVEVDMLQRDEYIKIGDALVYLPNLSPQIEKILLLLYKHKNSVVSRDQIAIEIWGEEDYIDKYSDYSIDKQISKLRKIIDDSSGNSEILETKKGKGYLLNI